MMLFCNKLTNLYLPPTHRHYCCQLYCFSRLYFIILSASIWKQAFEYLLLCFQAFLLILLQNFFFLKSGAKKYNWSSYTSYKQSHSHHVCTRLKARVHAFLRLAYQHATAPTLPLIDGVRGAPADSRTPRSGAWLTAGLSSPLPAPTTLRILFSCTHNFFQQEMTWMKTQCSM